MIDMMGKVGQSVRAALPFAALQFIFLMSGAIGLGKPIDAKAADRFVALGKLMERPLAERRIVGAELGKYLELWGEDNYDRKLCALLAFAFASDERSLTIVRETSKSKIVSLAGAAGYSLTMRERAGKAGEPMHQALAERLRASKNPIKTMFLANRLAVDFPNLSVKPILETLRCESDWMVKCDLLYYLYRRDDRGVDRELLRLPWHEEEALPENYSFIFGVITPGRWPQEAGKTVGEYLKLIHERNHRPRAGHIGGKLSP